MAPRAGEAKDVREGLDPRCFPDGECALFRWMDVPVAILCDVSGDRSAELVPGETVVFVVEDVGPIALKSFWQIAVTHSWLQKTERLPVILANGSGDVVPDHIRS